MNKTVEQKRQEFRDRFPEIAAAVDLLKANGFDDVHVIQLDHIKSSREKGDRVVCNDCKRLKQLEVVKSVNKEMVRYSILGCGLFNKGFVVDKPRRCKEFMERKYN